MTDILGKIFNILLMMFFIFVFIVGIYWLLDRIAQNNLEVAVNAFQSDVRNSGYIDEKMIRDFNDHLCTIGRGFTIKMIHDSVQYYPLDKPGDDGEMFQRQKYSFDEDTIYDVVYNKHQKYKMKIGDNFLVYVTTGYDSGLASLMSGISDKPEGFKLHFVNGGMINNEIE